MKKTVICLLAAILLVAFAGCAKETSVSNTVEGNMKPYYEMSDGSWMCDGLPYKYRLEISGRMPNAAVDSTFVYLSNIEEISFEQAYLAAGVSSSSDDYFSQEEAVLVEMSSE
ncbi:MAG: immunogenic protein [Firmicutes bacterium]|nr:immunogenic protein [Bacillota bacterium]